MFGLLRNRRRRRVLATAAIPDEIWRKVLVSVPVLDWLDTDEQSRLRALSLAEGVGPAEWESAPERGLVSAGQAAPVCAWRKQRPAVRD